MSQENKGTIEKLAIPTGFGALVAALIYFGFVKPPQEQLAEQIALEKRLISIEVSVQNVGAAVTAIDRKMDERHQSYINMQQMQKWAYQLERQNPSLSVPSIDGQAKNPK
jgi:hypothetical protein